MQRRHKLGLPLIEISSLLELPKKSQRKYEDAFVEAAREVGGLLLNDGDILRAWPYFRAIGETQAVAAAIDNFEPEKDQDHSERIIEIAFLERVNPRKGFELILNRYGICRAITSFGQYPSRQGREDCIRLLVSSLHNDLLKTLKQVITNKEGEPPKTNSINTITEGRNWLFGKDQYYIDASHLASIVRFSIDLSDVQTLKLALELADFGKNLPSMFQSKGDPPFDNLYEDYGAYLRALLGKDLDRVLLHFRRKIDIQGEEKTDHQPAQVLVGLLAKLERYDEALAISLQKLRGIDPGELSCPSIVQLCQLAGELDQLAEVAHDEDDLLSFAAAQFQAGKPQIKRCP